MLFRSVIPRDDIAADSPSICDSLTPRELSVPTNIVARFIISVSVVAYEFIYYRKGFLSSTSICFHIVWHTFSSSTLLVKMTVTRGGIVVRTLYRCGINPYALRCYSIFTYYNYLGISLFNTSSTLSSKRIMINVILFSLQ